jgi:WD40 repeat protein
MRSLAQALVEELPSDADTMKQLLGFDEPDVAFSMVRKWRESHLEALLVVDQFEELFTLNPPEVQERFTELLGRLFRDGDVHVLLSLRDDFLMRCHDHEALGRVFEHLTPLGPLSEDGLRLALTEPAKKEGFAFEDESLVDGMLESVADARGALPLLAFAVARLWEKRDRDKKLLTRKAYEEIGGVAGALAQHAEQTLERIGLEREPIVRELFRNLVTAQWTRAVADREELLSVLPDQEAGAQVLDQLIDARLLTSYEVREAEARRPESSGDSGVGQGLSGSRASGSGALAVSRHRIEIVHESLLRAWPRLVRWQAQDEEGAVLRDQLKQAARLWEEKSRSPDLLWSGDAFQEFELWRRRYPGRLTALEEEFAESMVHRARRRRRLRRMAVGGVVAASLAVAAVVGISRQQAVRQAERADRETLRAEASKLLALAELRLDEDPTEALALTTASLELADTHEAREFAVRVLADTPPATELLVSPGKKLAADVAFSPDGRWLATIGFAEEGHVWSDTGEGPVVLPGHVPNPNGGLQARWLSGGYLATGNRGAERAHIWSMPSGRRVRTIEFGGETFWWAGTANQLLAATVEGDEDASDPRTLLLRAWHIPDGQEEELARGIDASDGMQRTAFEPEGRGWIFARDREVHLRTLPLGAPGSDRFLGRHPETVELLYVWRDRLVSRDRGGELRIWSFPPEGPKLERVIPQPQGAPTHVLTEVSGRWLLDGSFRASRRVRLWDLTALRGARPFELRRSGSWNVSWLDFRPGGDWVAATTHGQERLTLWPLAGRRPSVVEGYSGVKRSLAFSPDGQWLAATAWLNDEVGIRLWPLRGREGETARTLSESSAGHLAFDPRGRYLVRLGRADGGKACIPGVVHLDGSETRLPGLGNSDGGCSIAVSPGGRRVATAFAFGPVEPRLKVRDVETGELRIFELPPTASLAIDEFYRGSVWDLHFVDESTLYTAGDGGLRRWNVDTGSHELVWAPEPEEHLEMSMDAGGELALTHVSFFLGGVCHPVELHNLATGEHRPLPEFGTCVTRQALDPSGRVAATGDNDGAVRVGSLSGGAPHLLLGHEGPVTEIAISPDLHWVGSMGEDGTLRLWPMPDLEKPPLHTLTHNELITKLHSLTNLRAVRDPDEPTGWTIELGPFPGWTEVPTW